MRRLATILVTMSTMLAIGAAAGGRIAPADDGPTAEKLYRERVLPILRDHCYECHSAKSDDLKGNLRVDTRAGLLKGGDNGPAVAPGEPERSFLLRAMSYREDDYKMPPRGKLDDELLADVERWIKLGAPVPADGR